ncbi:MAG: flavodoxin-dependent (E)-4-hydroxy-3-methylbut-2-enyl-diphosphate synthase [Ruminococcaceae bacterium]|nr:flavodoxin-dependent (E)-4-hydroxy-3-methylbut-2-enyl-diphosphate synthase [Oscillospiraceae bacterium]
MKRHQTRVVQVGPVAIGGTAPIAVQSMNNTDTRDVAATLEQIRRLAEAGCEITRVAVPDLEAADALAIIRAQSPLPIVADIHFDYRLALAAIVAGADKIRINPGTIGGMDRLRQVADAARDRHIPIRVGVNAGSLSQAILARYGGVTAEAMATSALEAVAMLEQCHFYDLVLSIKASEPLLNRDAYQLLSEKTDYPLHIGVTEAGTWREGIIRSSVGIGVLLAMGLGDTLRVSLTADPVEEVRTAWSILRALDLRRRGAQLISCPTCGRTEVDLTHIAVQVEERLQPLTCPIKVAVMGCAVNGPGEARQADVGIAGGRGFFLVFREGRILRRVPEEEAVDALMAEVEQWCAEQHAQTTEPAQHNPQDKNPERE